MLLETFLDAVPIVYSGLRLTVIITICSFLLGQLLSLPTALALRSSGLALSASVKAYTFFFRGSPLLVQLFIVYYGLGQVSLIRHSFLWPVLREPLNCAVLAIGLNSAAYSAEVLAGSMRSIPVGQIEACKALGMHTVLSLWKVVLPQAYRAILPSIANESILVLKASSLASAVTLMDITGAARAFTAKTYAPFEVFIVAALVYLALGLIFGRFFSALERRFEIGQPRLRAR
jgi:octopine/nopaline transport system permease protein